MVPQQTDGRTTTYDSNTALALRASRSKNAYNVCKNLLFAYYLPKCRLTTNSLPAAVRVFETYPHHLPVSAVVLKLNYVVWPIGLWR